MNKRRKDLPELSNIDYRHLENMFNVKKETDGMYYYDLTDTLYLNPDEMNPLVFEEHDVTEEDTLYGLSYRYYDTRNLWWLIGVANNIDNPFDLSNMVGETIKIPIKSVVGGLLTVISE